jgi:probable O-glycosylation ligase (exosortase A-associated)
MRDIVVLSIIACGAVYALRRPWVGAILSVWVSLMSPHVQFGWRAASMPVAQAIALTTLLGWLMSADRQNPFKGAPTRWFLAFWVWICITLPFSFYFDPSYLLWERSMKINLLVLMTLGLINTRKKLEWLIGIIVISLGYYGVKGGVFTVLTGGNYRVWGPGGFVEGNNELALAMVMLLPMVRYIHLHAANRYIRWAALGTLLLLPFTILGSHSRGALLALFAMGALLWIRSERKILGGVLFVAIAAAALAFMPAHWWERMETIQGYEQDASALGRINAWWNAWNLAKANLFGGGFMMYTRDVFAMYSPDPDRVHAAHSIYFQVLGEHGFVGLFIFLGIGAATWMYCQRLIAAGRSDANLKWAADLGAMTQVSMVGFAVGGAFLSLAYFDMPYYQMVAVVVAHRLVVAHRAGLAGRTLGAGSQAVAHQAHRPGAGAMAHGRRGTKGS